MNFRKYMVLIVGCGIALLVTLAAAVLLVQQITSAAKIQSDLSSAMTKLDNLNKRKPYPNNENVARTETNLVLISRALAETQGRLKGGQIETAQIKREFPQLLEETIRQLKEKAAANSVALPEHFAFGFDSYSAGTPPVKAAIPRLTVQLKTIASMCDLLYASKITNVAAITREEFETGAGREAASQAASAISFRPFSEQAYSSSTATRSVNTALKGIPPASSNELYSVERISLDFIGRENSVWEFLNDLAKGPPFCVVRDLSLENMAAPQLSGSNPASVRPTAATSMFGREYATTPPGGATTSMVSTNLMMTPREDRIVEGRETVRAVVVVDVFHFADGKGDAK